MDLLDKLKRDRDQVRRIFKRTIQQETLTDVDLVYLEEKTEELDRANVRIRELMLSAEDFKENEYEEEYILCESFKRQWIKIRVQKMKAEEEQREKRKKEEERKDDETKNGPPPSNLRLPKLEIRKFDDNPKSWIAFWTQFQKIHECKTIDEDVKFNYLIQAMAENSKAKTLVESYPPTKENYAKVIETLKNRFAKDEVLIEIYVRELLQLVTSKNSVTLDILYDKIIVNLQILASLGICKDKYECILLPLIESALPDETLILWSKCTLTVGSKLDQLLGFLKVEVEAEGRCRLARSTFIEPAVVAAQVPTASCLIAKEVRQEKQSYGQGQGKELCYFCDRQHLTLECGQAQKFNLEQKKDAIKKKGGCYICLKRGHLAKSCKAFVRCMYCSSRHLVILCPKLHGQSKTGEQSNEHRKEQKEEKIEVTNNFSLNNTTTLLQTLVVKVSGNNMEKNVRALLDSGSQRTYIKAGLTEELGLQVIGSERLGHSLFGGVKKEETAHRLIRFQVSDLDNTYQTMFTALENKELCGNLPKVCNKQLTDNLKKKDISLTDAMCDIKEISILIWSDFLGMILKGNPLHITENLVAVPTKLGWTLQGPIEGNATRTIYCHTNETVQENLEFMWNIESLGIKDPYEKQDIEILNNFSDNISVNSEGRYEVNLIWKEPPELETNYATAQKRLWSTTKKLENTKKLEQYHAVIEEWKREGIIETVQDDKQDEGHYLPHHAVIKTESVTTKIRPVFDASCLDKNKKSLNSCIEKGTNLMEVIPKLLKQFREGVHGVTSDIKKAFLQISVSPPDRKYLKLLWWKDCNKDEVITYQLTRVPFGVACSPFLLAATIKHHLKKHANTYPETAKRLEESFYVDNCLTSFDSLKEAENFEKEATELMEKGKFDLRGWLVGSTQDTELIPILGMKWNRQTDELSCNINLKTKSTEVTKRSLLSTQQQIFDPLGILSPTMLIPKLIIQKAWQLKTGWDEKIPTNLEREYQDWQSTINNIQECRVPRRLTDAPLPSCKVSVHVFCDASKDAYAGCVFLRAEHEKKVTVQLVIAKSRVAPIKRKMTLPRLELMDAVIASRLYNEVVTSGLLASCKDVELHCWTDSAVVLAWLKRHNTWKTFVSNRIKEICMNTNKESWKHLPGVNNPADLPSRGCDAKMLLQTHWWTGPEWLYLEEKDWPTSIISKPEKEEEIITSEERKSVAVHVEVNTEKMSDKLLYFNSYRKTVKLVARLLRMSPRVRKICDIKTNQIHYEEYKNAEVTLLKLIQKENYTEETEKTKNKKIITTQENGLLKVKTRLEYSGEDRDFIYPILLPGNNTIIMKLVQQTHKDMKHAGTQIIMATLRNTYWITGIRRLAKKAVSECTICRRYKAKHYEAPQPPLPTDRVGNTAAFEVTGIDLAGPLFLKNNQKCWIVLFTCAVYRAIHLELTNSLSTASFIMALRRFISRRGRAKIIYTDNGTNFVGTANLLREVNWHEVEEATDFYSIQWKFSAPAAPWWGGWWERLVRIVKDMLKRILGRASVDWVELSTILCDCEVVINSRPLTYIEMEGVRPLTPMMFLQGLSTNETPDLDQIDHNNLNIRFKYLQQLRQDFRIRFKNEYLSMLISKGKENRREPKIGDVVLIETESSRLHWPLGIVKEVFSGRDGCTRAAKVLTASGEKVRPYQRLYPLEISTVSQEWLSNIRRTGPSSGREQQMETSGMGDLEPPPAPLASATRSGRTIKLPSRFLD